MPDFLALPRELRDDIYELVFRSSLAIKNANFPRIRISKKKFPSGEETTETQDMASYEDDRTGLTGLPGTSNISGLSNPIYYPGEEAIRYPVAEAVPPTDPLLLVNQQIRAEMQETIQKKPVNWRIRLAFRDDKELLYPTWISMPAFTDRIDILDVEIRVRKKKTASLFSTTSSIASASSNNDRHVNLKGVNEGDVFFGGFALLQRLLERGPSFVSRKKPTTSSTNPMTIGCVTIHLLPKDLEYHRQPHEMLAECVDWVEQLLTDKDDSDYTSKDQNEEWQRIDKFLHFFAERIERFAFEIEGKRREWVMKDAMMERDERTALRLVRERERDEREREEREREEFLREEMALVEDEESSPENKGPRQT